MRTHTKSIKIFRQNVFLKKKDSSTMYIVYWQGKPLAILKSMEVPHYP